MKNSTKLDLKLITSLIIFTVLLIAVIHLFLSAGQILQMGV